MTETTVGTTSYSAEEKMLHLAKVHFGDSELLKAGLVGYVTEAMAQVHTDGMLHRTAMYDELFKSTAKLPTTINRYASWQKWEIPQAIPSVMNFNLIIPYADLEDRFLTYNVLYIRRTDYLDLGGIKFSPPYDIELTMVDSTITAKYILDSNITPITYDAGLAYAADPYLKVAIRSMDQIDPTSSSTTKFVYINMYLYQYELIEEVWEHYNAKDAIDRALYYTGSYNNQLVKFDVLHNGKLIDKFYNLNQTSDNMYCYYSYLEDGKISIYFDVTSSLKPSFGSTLKVQYCTSLGLQGNFDYSGTPYFTFNNPTMQNLSNICSIIKQPSGGKNKMSLKEIREYLAYLDLSRDSITSEYDLEKYFNDIISKNSDNNLQLTFFKKQDDIIKRIFYAFFLFKDANGVIIPTNTVNVKIPYNYLQANNFVLPIGTMFQYDQVSQEVKIMDNVDFNLIQTETHGKFYYMTPYTIRFNFNRFMNCQYLNLFKNNSFNVTYVQQNKKESLNYDILINSIDIVRNPMNTYDYKISIPFTLTNTENINNLTDLRCTVTIKDANLLPRFNFEAVFNKDSSRFEAVVTSTDTFNSINELKVTGINNLVTGENVAYIPSECNIQIDTHIKVDNEWLISSSYSSIQDEKLFFDNLNYFVKSDVATDDVNNVVVYDLPLIGARFGLNSNNMSNILTMLLSSAEIVNGSIDRLENNTEIDIKFYNTYGISLDYTSPYTNISLAMQIKLTGKFDPNIPDAIKLATIKYINTLSANKEIFSFSKIIRYLQNNFSNITYIIPNGWNGISIHDGSGDTIDLNSQYKSQQTINSFTDHAPEFLNVNGVYESGINSPSLKITFI